MPVILLGNKRDLEHTRQVQISDVSFYHQLNAYLIEQK